MLLVATGGEQPTLVAAVEDGDQSSRPLVTRRPNSENTDQLVRMNAWRFKLLALAKHDASEHEFNGHPEIEFILDHLRQYRRGEAGTSKGLTPWASAREAWRSFIAQSGTTTSGQPLVAGCGETGFEAPTRRPMVAHAEAKVPAGAPEQVEELSSDVLANAKALEGAGETPPETLSDADDHAPDVAANADEISAHSPLARGSAKAMQTPAGPCSQGPPEATPVEAVIEDANEQRTTKNKEHTMWRYALLQSAKHDGECPEYADDPESMFILDNLKKQGRGEMQVDGSPWKAAREAWRNMQA